jgi:DNA-binding response OmpR family regulator
MNEAVAKAVAHVLRTREGLASDIVTDVDEVMPLVRQQKPKLLILSDGFGYHFPMLNTSSFDLVEEIRNDQELAGLPVIMLCYLPNEMFRASKLDCTPLAEPFLSEELTTLVRRVLHPTESHTA